MRDKLPREFYLRDANELAHDLVGKLLVHRSGEGVASGIIIETEAYPGGEDAASHAYLNRKTRRTAVHFGPGGFVYMFLIYGMHCCFNVVAGRENEPQAVLVRALEPFEGIELMQRRRNTENKKLLCGGPGRLCAALGISMAHYGADLTGDELYIEDIGRHREIEAAKRINVDYAGACADYLWRYIEKGNPYISKK